MRRVVPEVWVTYLCRYDRPGRGVRDRSAGAGAVAWNARRKRAERHLGVARTPLAVIALVLITGCDGLIGLSGPTVGDAARDQGSSGLDGGNDVGHEDGSDDTPSLLIDNFDKGSPSPDDSRFMTWQCYTYNPNGGPVSCDVVAPGYNSDYCQEVTFFVRESSGTLDFPGAGIETVVTAGTVDLSRYKNFVFSGELVPELEAGLPAGTQVTVGFGCNQLSEGQTTTPGGVAVTASVVVPATWSTFPVPMASFAQSPSATPQVDGSTCLTVVDAITFAIQPVLGLSQPASGRFYMDNIYLE